MDTNQEGFSLIPRTIRFFISALVVGFTTIALSFAIYALAHLKTVDVAYLVAAMSLLQVAVITSGGWLFLHFSRARISQEMIQIETNKFLNEDIPKAIHYNNYYFDERGNLIFDLSVTAKYHVPGTTNAYYLITSKMFGSIVMFMQVNVKIIEVLYFVEPLRDRTQSRCDQDLKASLMGAESVGWKAHRYGVKHFNGPKGFYHGAEAEVVMIKFNLNEMFLFNSPIRVFMANDVAMMTRSFLEEAGYQKRVGEA